LGSLMNPPDWLGFTSGFSLPASPSCRQNKYSIRKLWDRL
jgi:hypothetical protein